MTQVAPYIGRLRWQEQIIGTGFVVHASGLIATCYHVLRAAVKEPIAGKTFAFEPLINLKVNVPVVALDRYDEQHDVALLQVEGPLPDGIEVASLVSSDVAISGMRFQVQGYGKMKENAETHDYSSAGGIIIGPDQERATKLLLLESKQVRRGMSGGPVIVEAAGGVVGVVSKRYSIDPKTETWMRDAVWATPIENVVALDPQHLRLHAPKVARDGAGATQRYDFYARMRLPDIYIVREKVLADVRKVLLANTPAVALTSAIRTTATTLHGMGGIGKSVIARAICDDKHVQDRFSDGILWTTLGQTPDLTARLSEWVTMCGGTINETAPTAERLKDHLATLLRERACLLIVDDVWKRADVEWFNVGGPRCRLLITTRDSAIAKDVGAHIHKIPAMAPDEAIALLEEWAAGSLVGVEPQIKATIIKRLGYLPLAVRLAGAQLRDKDPTTWLNTFDAHKLKTRRPDDVHDSLVQTFGLSLDELDPNARRLYVSLAIFREDEAIVEAGLSRLWLGLGGCNADEVAELLQDLADRALLELNVDSQPHTVVLHDLLRDFMAAELGDGRHCRPARTSARRWARSAAESATVYSLGMPTSGVGSSVTHRSSLLNFSETDY